MRGTCTSTKQQHDEQCGDASTKGCRQCRTRCPCSCAAASSSGPSHTDTCTAAGQHLPMLTRTCTSSHLLIACMHTSCSAVSACDLLTCVAHQALAPRCACRNTISFRHHVGRHGRSLMCYLDCALAAQPSSRLLHRPGSHMQPVSYASLRDHWLVCNGHGFSPSKTHQHCVWERPCAHQCSLSLPRLYSQLALHGQA